MFIKNLKFSQAGFTLLEVLIAILILSMLMLSIFTIVDSSITTQENITKEDRETLQIEAAVNRFEIDYSQIWSPLFYSKKKKKDTKRRDSEDESYQQVFEPSETFPIISEAGHPVPFIGNPEKNELVFYTISNRRKMQESKQSNYAWVQYKVVTAELKDGEEERAKGANLELIRKYTALNPYTKEFNWDKIRSQTLLKNIKSLKFEFWNKKSKKFVDSLRDVGSNIYLPTVVRIIITWIDKNTIEHETVRTFRPIWPAFDTSLDKIKKKRNSSNNGENEEDEDEDEDDGVEEN